jgi:3,4-dihydroxy 2-butanone 4-phosphate synthase/GTP cyclohydrolase II
VPASQISGEKTGSAAQRAQSWRDVGLGAQILRDLNVHSIRLITSSQRHYVGLSGFGIEIAETVRIGD